MNKLEKINSIENLAIDLSEVLFINQASERVDLVFKNGGKATVQFADSLSSYAVAHDLMRRVDAMNAQIKDSALEEALDAMEWFCSRVENGEVSSRRTYARFKEILTKNGR